MVMETNPLVSVVVPTYNCAHYLAAALDSVLAQTYRPIEVIVVDDGSTDNTADVVCAYAEVRYLYQPNQGAAVARNIGIAAAQGEFIAFLDADDVWQPDKLSIQVAYMLQHPSVGITATNALHFLEPGTPVPSWLRPDRDLGEKKSPIPSAMVVRKPVFSQIGMFSPDHVPSEDTEWLCRAKDDQISIVTLPEVLTLKRFHGANISWEMASTFASRGLRILKESIARKSQQASSAKSLPRSE